MSVLIISLITVFVTAAIATFLEFADRRSYMGSVQLPLLLLSCVLVDLVMTVAGSIVASLGWWSLLVLPCTIISSVVGVVIGFVVARPLWKIKRRLFPRTSKGKTRRPLSPIAPAMRGKVGR